MNRNGLNLQQNLSAVSRLLTVLIIVWLLGTLGLGWLVKSFAVIILLLLVTPVIAFFGFQWWLKRNLISDACPVCKTEFTALNQTQCRCPQCGEALSVENKQFKRYAPSGTIDVNAVDVSVKSLEEL